MVVSISIELAIFGASGVAHMKRQMFGTVGRATVPDPTTAPEQSFYFDLTGRSRPAATLI
jgi:hypothetical protein